MRRIEKIGDNLYLVRELVSPITRLVVSGTLPSQDDEDDGLQGLSAEVTFNSRRNTFSVRGSLACGLPSESTLSLSEFMCMLGIEPHDVSTC